MTVPALSDATLAGLPAAVARPAYDRAATTPGVVHLGVGGFHRAHQGVYLDRVLAAGHPQWAVTGVGVLATDRALHDVLTAQDGLYSVTEKHPDGTRVTRVVGALASHLLAVDDVEAVLAALAAPSTHLVTLTITEGGYCRDPATGEFEPTPAVRADLEPGATPRTAWGLLAAGLRRRRDAGTAAVTVVSCDNIVGNGAVCRQALLGYLGLADPELAAWVAAEVAFPSSMVDRITPVTTDADRAELAAAGVADGWPVVCEPWLQWVLEDRFSGPRPPLEDVGVTLVADVHGHELAKLRLLNAAHQVLSHLGRLAGLTTVDEVLADPVLRALLERYLLEEASPTLPAVPGLDLAEYRTALLARFANPHVSDTLARNCAQGSDRLPTFLLPVVGERLAAGATTPAAVLAVAAWARGLAGTDDAGGVIGVVDDRAERLAPLVARQEAGEPLALLEATEVFGALAGDERFRTAFAAALGELAEHGARGAAARVVG